jgi:predicted unusual protein kinase regulating ubiquinone biosynthesis (AarF/ABC1/UbiB family)
MNAAKDSGLPASSKPFGEGMSLAQFGWRGALRMAKTFGVLYPKAATWLFQWRKPSAREVRETFEQLGVTYIKLGQLIASSPSVFPRDYVEEFQACLDQTTPIPFELVLEVMEQDLERPVDELFEHIDPEPLASASIAQVHAATLRSGEDVVVKVQKPGVEGTLTTDMNFLFVSSRLVELVSPGLSKESITGMVSELYQSMLEECDFIKEAKNLDEFARFLERSGNTEVVVPRPYHHASSKKVLTMERFYGVPLTDYDNLQQYTDDPARVLILGLNTWFTSLMQCDFFHADLHSGNIMLLEDGRLGFIDFGMVGHITPGTWEAMFTLLDGLSHENYQQIAKAMVAVGMTSEDVDTQALTRDIEQLFRRAEEMTPEQFIDNDIGNDVNQLLLELAELGKAYGIRFPRSFTLLLKQFLYFDRYVQLLVPDMDLFNDARIDLLQ